MRPLFVAIALLFSGVSAMAQTPPVLPNTRPWDQPFLPPAPAWDGASKALLSPSTDPWPSTCQRAPEPDAVHLVNAVLEARRPTHLELDGTALRIGHRHAETPVDDALALIAEAVVEELATGRPERLRVCANDRCRWAFFDSSPTGRRRWCDMRSCGNQAKAARHRARMRGDHVHDGDADEAPARPN